MGVYNYIYNIITIFYYDCCIFVFGTENKIKILSQKPILLGIHKKYKKSLLFSTSTMHRILSLALYNLYIELFPSLFLLTQFLFFLLFFLDNGYFQVSFCFILSLLSLLGMQQCCSQGVSQGLPRVSVS